MTRKTQMRAALLLTLAAAMPATAANFCVSAGDQLQNALETASSNNQNDTIRITAGTKTYVNPVGYPFIWEYTPNSSVESDNTLAISGGWNSNCTTYSLGAQHTILDGQNLPATVLQISPDPDFAGDINAAITVSNLSFIRAGGFNALVMFAAETATNAQFYVESVQVAGGLGGVSVQGGRIEVTNFVLYGATVSSDAVEIIPARPGSKVAFASVYNNVFSDSNDVALQLKGVSRIVNVAAFGNRLANGTAVKDAELITTAIDYAPRVENNYFQNYIADYYMTQGMTGTSTGPASTQGITVGTFVVAQPAFGPMQNSALTIDPMPARDVYGRARITQWAPDRGAIESDFCRAPIIAGIQDFQIAERQANGLPHPVGTTVGTTAANTWGTTTLSLTGGNSAGIFSFSANGTIQLSNPALLDYETQTQHYLTVLVTDYCGTASGTVRINVTDYLGDAGAILFASSFE